MEEKAYRLSYDNVIYQFMFERCELLSLMHLHNFLYQTLALTRLTRFLLHGNYAWLLAGTLQCPCLSGRQDRFTDFAKNLLLHE